MPSAGWALQTAIHQRLTSDAPLTALLGGAHVWDHVPRGAAYPHVTIGISTERDWSTGGEPGSEHILTLNVWSRAAGRREAQSIATAVREALHNQALTLTAHRLVNLQHELSEVRRDVPSEMYRGVIRLRAVTEPL